MSIIRSALLVSLFGCATNGSMPEEPPIAPADDDHPDLQGPSEDPAEPTEVVPLVTDMCDEPTFAGATWTQSTSAHFTLNALPGTPADLERATIATRLEAAYDAIRASLGITAEPQLTLNLSPSRNAAVSHNRGFGRVWPNVNRYDVIYTGAADSYELQRYGQLLTVMLDFHFDPSNRYRVPVLSTGIAEYLDQSGRDMHDAYADQLLAGIEARVRLAEMDARDVTGRNPGRSGSLVKFLVDRYGMETFVDLYRASAVTWNGNCNINVTYGCIGTPAQLTSMLDGLLVTHTGEGWNDVQPLWQATVEEAIDRAGHGMASDTTAQIEHVLHVMDEAITTDNAASYRTTVEGFYCDWGGEAIRNEVSARAVNAYGSMQTQLLALYDTGIKNFPTANAFVMRVDGYGVPSFATINFEHLPVGWRVTYSPDWY